jgi:hypothetical protein
VDELRDRDRNLARIRRAAALTGLRLRLRLALGTLPPAFLAVLGLMAATLAVHRALPDLLPARLVTGIITALPTLALAAALASFVRGGRPQAGAAALERHHGLRGRLSAALAFAALPSSRCTALMDLAIDDACGHAGRLSPRAAAPLHAPRGLLLASSVALATVATARLHTASEVPVPPPPVPAPSLDTVKIEPDDLALWEGTVCGLMAPNERPDPETVRFRRLVRDLGAGRLDLEGVLRRIRWIEESVDRSGEPGTNERRSALREHLGDLRELLRQPRNPVRAARASAFGRRARGATSGGEGEDCTVPGACAIAEAEDDPADLSEPPTPHDEPRLEPRPPQCAGGSVPGEDGDRPGRGKQGGEESAPPETRSRAEADTVAPRTGRDPAVMGAPGGRDLPTRDVRASARDTRRGKSRREVILAAARRGFRGAGYHDVFVQYRTVAQAHLEQDRIPDGQRFYVRRYFQLIRPRE